MLIYQIVRTKYRLDTNVCVCARVCVCVCVSVCVCVWQHLIRITLWSCHSLISKQVSEYECRGWRPWRERDFGIGSASHLKSKRYWPIMSGQALAACRYKTACVESKIGGTHCPKCNLIIDPLRMEKEILARLHQEAPKILAIEETFCPGLPLGSCWHSSIQTSPLISDHLRARTLIYPVSRLAEWYWLSNQCGNCYKGDGLGVYS